MPRPRPSSTSGRPRGGAPTGYAAHLLRKRSSLLIGLHVSCVYRPNRSVCNIQEASDASKNGDEEEEEEVVDEETLRRDQVVKGAIEVLIREYASELNAPSQDPDSQPRNKKRKEKKEEVLLSQ